MAPGSGGAVPQRLDEFLAFGVVVDGGELLRQIQVIPADNAILDEALTGLGELLILLFGVQKLPWAANGHSAGKAMHVLDAVEFAAFERDILRDRVRAGIAAARKAGKAHGCPITIQKYLPEIRRLHAAGTSKRDVAKRLRLLAHLFEDCWKHPERAVDRCWLVPGRLREWRPTSQILWDFTYLCWKLT